MARGGKGGHTSHRQPSRPHAGDRRLAGLVRRSVRPGEVPTMGGAAPTGRATGAGRPRGARPSEIQQNRPGLLPPAGSTKALEARTKILKKAARLRDRIESRITRSQEGKASKGGSRLLASPKSVLSRQRLRELGRTSRRVGELEREFIPVKPVKRGK